MTRISRRVASIHSVEEGRLFPEPATEVVSRTEDSVVRRKRTIVCLVDSMTLRRECMLRALRGAARDFDVQGVAHAATAGADLADEPDIVLFNANAASMADEWVCAAIERLRGYTSAPILILSDLTGAKFALEAVSKGLRGYVPTSVDVMMLVAAIRLVLAGGTFITQEIVADFARRVAEAPSALESPDLVGFTPREAEVIRKIRQGKMNKIIAHEMGITESTVKIHVRHIMRKLNATNRTQVVCLTGRHSPGELAGNL
jgi:DNA-binding NarL/FixJ family response regulator